MASRGRSTAPKVKHRAAVTDPKAIGAMLRAIEGYDGQAITLATLRLAPLLFVRPGELRNTEWTEFDLDAEGWRIPAAKMKMRLPHRVPLARQAIALLRDLQRINGCSPIPISVRAQHITVDVGEHTECRLTAARLQQG